MQHVDAAGSAFQTGRQAGEVTSIEVTRYRRPAPQSEKTLSNALITVRGAGGSGEAITGYGEVPFRGQRTGGGISATCEFLAAAMAELEGFEVDLSSNDSARRSLIDFSARIKQSAEAAGDGSVKPFAGARFGLETAFADFAAKGLRTGLGELLCGNSYQAAIGRPLRAQGANGSIRRGSLERVLQTLPPNADLPIDLRGALSFERARTSLERLIELANTVEIAHPIVIHRPLRASQEERWVELQEHLDKVSSSTPLKPVLKISQNLTREPSNHGRPAQGVTVMPAAAGGLLEAYEQIRALRAGGAEQIALVDADGADSIGYAALKSLATTMPDVTVLLRPRPGDGGHPEGYGHGGNPDWRRVLEGYRESFAVGEVHDPIEWASYAEAEGMRRLGANGVSSALLLAEALRRGVRTRRSSRSRFKANLGEEKVTLPADGSPIARGHEGNQATIEQTLTNALAEQGIRYVSGAHSESNTDGARGSRGFAHTGAKEEQYLSVLALGTKLLSVLERQPLTVVGDGTRTVAELLIQGPMSEKRESSHPWASVDERVARSAERHGVDLDAVPAAGEIVFLSSRLNLSRGATAREILPDLPEGMRETVERALRAAQNEHVIALDLIVTPEAGVDGGPAVKLVSVDTAPSLAHFAYPSHGAAQDVITPVAHALFSSAGTESEGNCPAIRISVRGKVTRVGYRAWAQRLAEKLSITGWARNVTDERVEIVAVGPPLELAVLATRAVQGPTKAQVNSVTTTPIEAPDVSDFAIVRKRPAPIIRLDNDANDG